MFSSTGPELVKVALTGTENESDDEFEKAIKNQKRPDSYYFARWKDEDGQRFAAVALTGEKVLQMSKIVQKSKGRILDLDEYNAKVQRQLDADRRKAKRRPGKKHRLRKIEAKKRVVERKKKVAEQLNLTKKQVEKPKFKRPGNRPISRFSSGSGQKHSKAQLGPKSHGVTKPHKAPKGSKGRAGASRGGAKKPSAAPVFRTE